MQNFLLIWFLETGDIGMGRGWGQGLGSFSLEVSGNKVGSFHHNALYASQGMPRTSNCTRSDSTMLVAQEMRTTNKNPSVHEKKHAQSNIAFSPSPDQVMEFTQIVEPNMF